MALPLLDRAHSGNTDGLVRLTAEPSIFDLVAEVYANPLVMPPVSPKRLIPERDLEEGEQYRYVVMPMRI